MSVKSFRAEVTVDPVGRWILLVPSVDNLEEEGNSLLDAERRISAGHSPQVRHQPNEICLELQSRHGVARRRARRSNPDISPVAQDDSECNRSVGGYLPLDSEWRWVRATITRETVSKISTMITSNKAASQAR